jgi:hypothetical protein
MRGKLGKINASGGSVQTICDIPAPPKPDGQPGSWRAGAWSRQGVIIFGVNGTGLWRAESGFYLPGVGSRIVARQDYALSEPRPVFGGAVKVPLERKHRAVKLHFSDERLTMPNFANAPMQGVLAR